MKEKINLAYKIYRSFICRLITLINNKKTPEFIYTKFFKTFSDRKIIDINIERKFYKLKFQSKNNIINWYFPRDNRSRGSKCYRQGLYKRAQELAYSYKINKISFKENDIVFDCGANYGDLWIFLNNLNININYYGFEPGIKEYQTLELNMKNSGTKIISEIYKIGLGDSNCTKNFYYSPDDGDSSLIEISNYKSKLEIEVIKLDTFINNNIGEQKIKLLKLEAEGGEPEVLLGCKDKLKNIEYIAADVGPERGINKEFTFTDVINYLQEKNFILIDFGYPRLTALFRNKSFME